MPNKAKHEDFVIKYFAGQTYQLTVQIEKKCFLKDKRDAVYLILKLGCQRRLTTNTKS